MLKVKQIGTVTFDQGYADLLEELSDDTIIGETVMSAAGTHISYVAEIVTPYITVDSGGHAWITDAQRIELISMRRQLESTFTITYSDDSTDTVRFAHEKKMEFSEVSKGIEVFSALIPLAKVIL